MNIRETLKGFGFTPENNQTVIGGPKRNAHVNGRYRVGLDEFANVATLRMPISDLPKVLCLLLEGSDRHE